MEVGVGRKLGYEWWALYNTAIRRVDCMERLYLRRIL